MRTYFPLLDLKLLEYLSFNDPTYCYWNRVNLQCFVSSCGTTLVLNHINQSIQDC